MRAALALLVLLATATASRSDSSTTIKTPEPCKRLIVHLGGVAAPSYTIEEARQALAHLGPRMILVSEARACRRAILRELAK